VSDQADGGSSHRPSNDGALALALDGPTTPPRVNGELVFDTPWQSRAFAVTAALADRELLSWSVFQEALIAQVAAADRSGVDTGTPNGYWGCWLDALGTVTDTTGLVATSHWSARCEELADRLPGHDH
jgi:nitrile hydratase accessory protein